MTKYQFAIQGNAAHMFDSKTDLREAGELPLKRKKQEKNDVDAHLSGLGKALKTKLPWLFNLIEKA